MIRNPLISLTKRFRGHGTRCLALALAIGSLGFNVSCTTEEGVVAGALAGAALGGIIGHNQEQSHKRARHYRNRGYYDDGYRDPYRYDDYRPYRDSRPYRGNYSYNYRDPYRYY